MFNVFSLDTEAIELERKKAAAAAAAAAASSSAGVLWGTLCHCGSTVDTFLYFDFPHPRGCACGEASIGGARRAVPVAWEVGSSLDITIKLCQIRMYDTMLSGQRLYLA